MSEPDGALARHVEQARAVVRTVETAPPYLPISDPVLSDGFGADPLVPATG